MRITFALCVLVAIPALVTTAPPTAGKTEAAQNAPATQPAAAGKGGELAGLEAKLLGNREGGACVGDYTFKSDGTFELRHFTPGGNTLTGTWSVRWDALPPTLVLTCKTSDFRR